MRLPGVAACLVILILAVPLSAASSHSDFQIHFPEGASPTFTGPAGFAELVEADGGERYAWNLSLAKDYTVAEVRVTGAFDVERVKQVLPLVDGVRFVELFTRDVTEVDEPARVIVIDGDVDDFTYRLGLPGPGNVTLSFERDVDPPGFEIGEVRDVTHYAFFVNATTTEPALAELRIRPADGSRDWVIHRTPDPATVQRFPIQGLTAEREYEVRLNFTDWSGNVAESAPFHVTTIAAPVFPAPVLTILDPAPDARVPDGDVTVRVAVESEDEVTRGGVRLFVDNQPVDDWSFADGVLEYAPAGGFSNGLHSVNLEVTTTVGGSSAVRWVFTVGPAETPLPPLPVLLAGFAAAALVARRR